MISEVRDAVGALEAAVGGLSPERLDGRDAARLLKVLAKGERLCAAGKARVVRRVDETRVWRDSGQPSAAAFLAATTGTTLGQAIGTLATAERLEELPATAEAFMAGQLSETQAREISAAASVDPSAERDLLFAAKVDGVKGLKDKCARVKAAAVDDTERHRRIHASRYYRRWTDADGAARGEFKLTPDAVTRLDAAMKVETQAVFRAARAGGQREPHDAYAADALVAMAERALGGDGTRRAPKATVVLHADASGWTRGHTEPGERCEIPGAGPVPVTVAREVFGDALLKVVITKGIDIRTVAHTGRSVNALQGTAAAAKHSECCVAGCHRRRGLEHHHTIDYADTHHTRIEEIVKPCGHHHDLVTYRGWTLVPRPDGECDCIPPGGSDDGERAPP